jgi:hypothetical protein
MDELISDFALSGRSKLKEPAVGERRDGGGGDLGVDGGGVRDGVPGHAAVGQGQHGLEHHQGLLHQHVAHAPEVSKQEIDEHMAEGFLATPP